MKKIIAFLLAMLSVIGFSGCNFADETERVAMTVTDVYFSVENFFVEGYEKVQDQFIEWFFAKDGETVEEAKDRLNNTNK